MLGNKAAEAFLCWHGGCFQRATAWRRKRPPPKGTARSLGAGQTATGALVTVISYKMASSTVQQLCSCVLLSPRRVGGGEGISVV